MNSVLVAEPVGTLDGIVHVPPPIILVHVTQRSIDTALRGHGVASSREELGDAGSVEPSLGKTEGSAQARAAGSDDNGIVLVVLGGKAHDQPPCPRDEGVGYNIQ